MKQVVMNWILTLDAQLVSTKYVHYTEWSPKPHCLICYFGLHSLHHLFTWVVPIIHDYLTRDGY